MTFSLDVCNVTVGTFYISVPVSAVPAVVASLPGNFIKLIGLVVLQQGLT